MRHERELEQPLAVYLCRLHIQCVDVGHSPIPKDWVFKVLRTRVTVTHFDANGLDFSTQY